jgi:hypothetical protein
MRFGEVPLQKRSKKDRLNQKSLIRRNEESAALTQIVSSSNVFFSTKGHLEKWALLSTCVNAKQVTAMDLIVWGLCKQEFFEVPETGSPFILIKDNRAKRQSYLLAVRKTNSHLVAFGQTRR